MYKITAITKVHQNLPLLNSEYTNKEGVTEGVSEKVYLLDLKVHGSVARIARVCIAAMIQKVYLCTSEIRRAAIVTALKQTSYIRCEIWYDDKNTQFISYTISEYHMQLIAKQVRVKKAVGI